VIPLPTMAAGQKPRPAARPTADTTHWDAAVVSPFMPSSRLRIAPPQEGDPRGHVGRDPAGIQADMGGIAAAQEGVKGAHREGADTAAPRAKSIWVRTTVS
jgi:hypothetical protein